MRKLVVTASVLTLALALAPLGRADEDMSARVAAADSYLATRPGVVGYVLRDRSTGAVYRNAHAADPVWTASTIKLAMVVDLLIRQRAGLITLSDGDNRLTAAMLHSSDDDAADALWSRYGGADHQAYNNDFPAYGMTGLRAPRGYSDTFPYWGFQKAAPDDLDRLINYTLTRMNPADTASIVDQLRHVDANQQWGVWGAGAAMAPGNKDGWSLEDGGWVVNTVGFAGNGRRYTLTVMNDLGGKGGYDDGVATTTHLAQLLLAGRDR
ncbi:MAG TPA: tat pathway signal sequence [Mycobacterium sp.]|nr:tat pathway signal sequence [Mycobacterium sp.]